MSDAMALPAFSFDWVGGDIAGLATLAERCAQVAPEITGADTALTTEVGRVVAAGSWQGSAASAFATAWDADARAGKQLATAWGQIGNVTGDLALCLAGLEHDLEQAAFQLQRQGVAVDLATGVALADVTASGNANVAPQLMAVHTRLAGPYEDYRTAVMHAAQQARAAAATALGQLAGQLLPAGRDWGQGVTGLDALRALWAAPTEYRKYLQEDLLPEAEQNLNAVTRSAFREAIKLKAKYGSGILLPKETRSALATARLEKGTLQGKIASAPENASTRLADGDAGLIEGSSGLADAGRGLVRGVPYVGATVAAGITIYQDREHGQSWGRALTDGIGSNGAALAAGGGTAVAGTAVLGAVGAAPVVAVVGGVIAGGVAAVGVGDFTHYMIQDVPGDWHRYGVLHGTVHAFADSFDHTGHDMAHYIDDLNPF